MATINRFSRPSRPAEFKPMTADEIMRVPLLKGQMEQEQLQAIEDKRLAMLNVDVAPGDMERVRAEQARLTGEFDSLVNSITSEGVGYKTSDRVNKFMRKYNESTSAQGVIGNAAKFAADRKLRREQDRQLAIKLGYDMQKWDTLAQAHDSRQTSIGEDGSLISEYKNMNLPDEIEPSKLFTNAMKGSGFVSSGNTLGEMYKSNEVAITGALDKVLMRWDNEPEFRQVMEDLGYDRELLQQELVAQADIMLEKAYIEYKDKPLTEAEKKAYKKQQEEALTADELAKERIFSQQEGPISKDKSYTPPKKLAELKEASESFEDPNTPEARAAKDTYLRAKYSNDEMETLYAESAEGEIKNLEVEEATNKLISKGDSIFSGSPMEIQEWMKDPANQRLVNLDELRSFQASNSPWDIGTSRAEPSEPGKEKETGRKTKVELVEGEDGVFHIYMKDNESFEEYKKVLDKRADSFNKFLDKNHKQRTWYGVASTVEGGTSANNTNTPIINNARGKLVDAISGESGETKVTSATVSYTNAGDENNETIYEQVTDEAKLADMRRRLASLDDNDIKDLKFSIENDYDNGAIKITFSDKYYDSKGKEVPGTFTVEAEMLGDETSEWGMFLSSLSGASSQQAKAITHTYQQNRKFRNVVPTGANADKGDRYQNASETAQTIKFGIIGGDLVANTGGQVEVFTNFGSSNSYGLRGLIDAGTGVVEKTLTISDVITPYGGSVESIKNSGNKQLSKWLVNEYGKTRGVQNLYEKPELSEKLEEGFEEFVESLTYSTDPFLTDSKTQLLTILSQ